MAARPQTGDHLRVPHTRLEPVPREGRAPAEPAVTVRTLTKSYGELEAVAGIDLTIRRGEVFALLGPNGAGKTTTVEILAGHRRRTGGDVTVLGLDPETAGRALRERIGIVMQEGGLPLDFTARESVELFSAAYPDPLPVDETLELVGLDGSRDARIRSLSGGQRRRLDLAVAVAGNPELLFLDEPTTGFDPSARRQSWELIESLRSLGKTRRRVPRVDAGAPLTRRRSYVALARMWVAARIRLIARTPRPTFFTLVFPLILLVMFDALDHSRVSVVGGKVDSAQFFTPSIAVFALTSANYTAIVFGVATAREQGVLKRVRGTPLPMSVFLGSWLVSAVLTGATSVVLMFLVAVPVFGVDVYPRMIPAAIVTLLLGAVAISSVGLAVSSFVKRADTAPIVANLTLFPLLFVSGVFYPIASEPHWLQRLAHVFPVSHLVEGFSACFSPFTHGSGFSARDLSALAVWGGVGISVAVKRTAREAFDEDASGSRVPTVFAGGRV